MYQANQPGKKLMSGKLFLVGLAGYLWYSILIFRGWVRLSAGCREVVIRLAKRKGYLRRDSLFYEGHITFSSIEHPTRLCL